MTMAMIDDYVVDPSGAARPNPLEASTTTFPAGEMNNVSPGWSKPAGMCSTLSPSSSSEPRRDKALPAPRSQNVWNRSDSYADSAHNDDPAGPVATLHDTSSQPAHKRARHNDISSDDQMESPLAPTEEPRAGNAGSGRSYSAEEIAYIHAALDQIEQGDISRKDSIALVAKKLNRTPAAIASKFHQLSHDHLDTAAAMAVGVQTGSSSSSSDEQRETGSDQSSRAALPVDVQTGSSSSSSRRGQRETGSGQSSRAALRVGEQSVPPPLPQLSTTPAVYLPVPPTGSCTPAATTIIPQKERRYLRSAASTTAAFDVTTDAATTAGDEDKPDVLLAAAWQRVLAGEISRPDCAWEMAARLRRSVGYVQAWFSMLEKRGTPGTTTSPTVISKAPEAASQLGKRGASRVEAFTAPGGMQARGAQGPHLTSSVAEDPHGKSGGAVKDTATAIAQTQQSRPDGKRRHVLPLRYRVEFGEPGSETGHSHRTGGFDKGGNVQALRETGGSLESGDSEESESEPDVHSVSSDAHIDGPAVLMATLHDAGTQPAPKRARYHDVSSNDQSDPPTPPTEEPRTGHAGSGRPVPYSAEEIAHIHAALDLIEQGDISRRDSIVLVAKKLKRTPAAIASKFHQLSRDDSDTAAAMAVDVIPGLSRSRGQRETGSGQSSRAALRVGVQTGSSSSSSSSSSHGPEETGGRSLPASLLGVPVVPRQLPPQTTAQTAPSAPVGRPARTPGGSEVPSAGSDTPPAIATRPDGERWSPLSVASTTAAATAVIVAAGAGGGPNAQLKAAWQRVLAGEISRPDCAREMAARLGRPVKSVQVRFSALKKRGTSGGTKSPTLTRYPVYMPYTAKEVAHASAAIGQIKLKRISRKDSITALARELNRTPFEIEAMLYRIPRGLYRVVTATATAAEAEAVEGTADMRTGSSGLSTSSSHGQRETGSGQSSRAALPVDVQVMHRLLARQTTPPTESSSVPPGGSGAPAATSIRPQRDDRHLRSATSTAPADTATATATAGTAGSRKIQVDWQRIWDARTAATARYGVSGKAHAHPEAGDSLRRDGSDGSESEPDVHSVSYDALDTLRLRC